MLSTIERRKTGTLMSKLVDVLHEKGIVTLKEKTTTKKCIKHPNRLPVIRSKWTTMEVAL
jgi:hypothetical protein